MQQKHYQLRNNKEIQSYNAKRFTEFRNSFDTSEEVLLESVKLEEPVHINAKVKLYKEIERYKANQKEVTMPLIVRKAEDGYVLLAGWKYYHLAHALLQDAVKVFVSNFENRLAMMKAIGCHAPLKVCRITDLKIPAALDCTVVANEKLEAIKAYDYKHHAQMEPIVVNRDMLIVDGYSQYVYNRNMEKEYCEVRFVK